MSKTPYYTPMPNFDKMTPDELKKWLEEQITWLKGKQRREQNYLQGRAVRQRYSGRGPTTTDDAYNADQPHETAMIAFLEHFRETLDKV